MDESGVSCRFALALSLSLAFGCAEARPGDPVILSLGDQVVRRSDFEQHLHRLEAGNPRLSPNVRRSLLESFLEERVLVLEARARGLVAPGADPGAEQAAVRRLLAAEVLSRVEVSDAEVEAYFKEHAAEFNVPEAVTLRQVLVPTANEAREMRRRLLRDPSSFEAIARTLSRGPEASNGGFMGTFTRGQLPPELEEAAFGLPVGGLSDVVATPYGQHVLKLEARRSARERSLDECRDEVKARLASRKSDEATHLFVRELLKKAMVNYEAAQAPTRDS